MFTRPPPSHPTVPFVIPKRKGTFHGKRNRATRSARLFATSPRPLFAIPGNARAPPHTMPSPWFTLPPATPAYILANTFVPDVCLGPPLETAPAHDDGTTAQPRPPLQRLASAAGDPDRLVHVDITVVDGKITAIDRAIARPPQATSGSSSSSSSSSSSNSASPTPPTLIAINLGGGLTLPCFADLHTHIDKAFTCERSANRTGSLTGADRSTAADAAFWDGADVGARMDFSLRCAAAHGTACLRTHLINMTPRQVGLTWPAFAKARAKWAGVVELQGVSLVALSFFRDEAAAAALADTVAAHGGALGAAVCCAEDGGDPADEWTTCARDRHALLDRMFGLAGARGLDLDFHTDENGNAGATGLVDVCAALLRARAATPPFTGRVVCGHCCALAAYPPDRLGAALAAARGAGVTVVSLPLVNAWTQDRDRAASRTPRWRGLTTLRELEGAGVPVALASDNVRDQFYAYGDYDLLEVLREGVRGGHLDCPYGSWAGSVTAVPARAMGLGDTHGVLRVGGGADLVAFKARSYSELLARPQADRVVVRRGAPFPTALPDYAELAHVRPQRGFESGGAAAPGGTTPARAGATNGRGPGHHRGGGGGPAALAAAASALRAASAGSPPPPFPRGLEGGVDFEFGARAKREAAPASRGHGQQASGALQPEGAVGGGGGGGVMTPAAARPAPPPLPATPSFMLLACVALAGAAVGGVLARR